MEFDVICESHVTLACLDFALACPDRRFVIFARPDYRIVPFLKSETLLKRVWRFHPPMQATIILKAKS